MTNHTPTPWHVEICRQHGENFDTILIRGHGKQADAINEDNQTLACLTGRENAAANAAFIVRAVNSHQHLVEALKAIVAALTQPVQTSGLREPTTCDILRGDARFAVNTARQALNQAKL